MSTKLLPNIELKSVIKTPKRKETLENDTHFQDNPEIVVEPCQKTASPNSGNQRKIAKPADRSISIIHGENYDSRDYFVQLNELDENGLFFKEKARWIKYEEDVQLSGNWGRPFLPYIDAECLRTFKQSLQDGLVLLGSVNDGAYNISCTISSMLELGGYVEPRHRARLQQILTLPRMHQEESTTFFRKKVRLWQKYMKMAINRRQELMMRVWDLSDNEVRNRWVKLAWKALDQHRKENGRKLVFWQNILIQDRCPVQDLLHQSDDIKTLTNHLLPTNPANRANGHHGSDTHSLRSIHSEATEISFNDNHRGNPDDYQIATSKIKCKLRKIIHPKSKGVVILHAAVDFLRRDKFISVLVRFKNEKPIVDSMEIPISVQFVYILVTSKHNIHIDGYETCRAVGTLLKDKTFVRYALRAKSVKDLIEAANKFIDGSVMLPPGNWKTDLLIPVAGAISEISRKKQLMRKFKHREGKDLWRVVRSKLLVIRMMKGLIQANVIKDQNEKVSEETTKEEKHHATTFFPRRGDCATKTRFRKNTHQENDNNDEKPLINGYHEKNVNDDEENARDTHPLHATGKLFGGLRKEIAKRYPIYWSDIKDGFHIQCLASLFYLSISLTAMCLTYGQVIAKYTKNNLGPSEMLSATALSCILLALFGTEPLSVIAGTAAMMIFESSIYQIADLLKLDFFQLRFFTGIWIFVFLLLILVFDKTHWIHYCTRFTEEILHVLVALLFMYEGIKNLVKIYEKHPLRGDYATIKNSTFNSTMETTAKEKPNTALLYTLFMFATFGIALGFRLFEKTRFFSPRIRRLLNFFSIPFAVNIMNAFTYFLSVYLNTIKIPDQLQPTSMKRERYIVPDFQKISESKWSYWTILFAAIPALLTVILLFIESEITLLECFKHTRGRKGSGFHVNLLIVAIMVLVSSFLGLPWMCLAAVETSVHLDSLQVWSTFDAPGVEKHVVKIREQRLTLLFTGILVGLAAFANSYLNHIPEAVFSGMVLYMGVVALFGVQMVERFFLMFMAPGQHPDIPYLKNVSLFKIYLFTMIQIFCVMVLWIVKSFKIISPIFPLVVLLMIPLRVLLGKVFSANEMEQLDNEGEEDGRGPLD